ncbi:Lipoprotein [Cupriavidus sp. H19C3]
MHRISATAAAAGCALLMAGCAGTNYEGLTQAGGSLFSAASLSDTNVKQLSDQSCAEMDKKNTIAPADSTYAKRLTNIMAGLTNTGLPLDAKVYMTKDVNAWAMANGCVRVYSGLMDMMTDDEVRGVLGHEIGHVGPVRFLVCRGHETITEITSYDRCNRDQEEQEPEGAEAVPR